MKKHLMVAASMIGLCGPVEAGVIFDDIPDIVICTYQATDDRPAADVVYVLFARLADGRVSYNSTGGGRASLRFNADGIATTENLGNCSGATLEELAAAGQTRSLGRTD